MGEYACFLLAVLHKEPRHIYFTVTEDSRMLKADFVAIAENRFLYIIFYINSSTLQVFVRLIAKIVTDEDRIIDRRL